jgi:hypothetical protein
VKSCCQKAALLWLLGRRRLLIIRQRLQDPITRVRRSIVLRRLRSYVLLRLRLRLGRLRHIRRLLRRSLIRFASRWRLLIFRQRLQQASTRICRRLGWRTIRLGRCGIRLWRLSSRLSWLAVRLCGSGLLALW